MHTHAHVHCTHVHRCVLLVSRRDITTSSRVEEVLLGVTETQLQMVSQMVGVVCVCVFSFSAFVYTFTPTAS